MVNSIAEGLQADPEMAEKILTMAGKMGAAMMAIRIRQLEMESDKLKQSVKRLEQSQAADRANFEQKIIDLTDRTKAAIDRLRESQK